MSDANPLPARVAKFLVTGASGMAVDLAVLESLHRWAHWHHLAGAVAGFWTAMTWNFALNRTWTFRAGHLPLLPSYARYAAGTLAGFGVRFGVQAVLGHWIHHLPAAATGIAAGTVLNFAASQLWAFRGK